MKRFLLLPLCALTMTSNAQVTPKVLPEKPVAGQKYILVNKAQNATQYMSRTSWDGALYFLGEKDSNYEDNALTAVDNQDGTWSFVRYVQEEQETGDVDENDQPIKALVDVTYYLGVPDGTANVKSNIKDPVAWKLDVKSNGFYNLILGEGNNQTALDMAAYTPTKDLRLHLNNGGQYFVATYYSGPWFPDCLGGVNQEEDESTGNVNFSANDSTSFNWGFVSLNKVQDYYADLKYSGAINSFYEKYCNIEGYEKGFLATYNVVAEAYKKAADYDELAELDLDGMMDAKVALQKEIDAAIALNENDDAVLAAAVQNAMKAFDTLTAKADVENATATLKKAEADYSLGTGDITSLGANMSFEDLSSQGGTTTTGVGAAPAGWNVYINGVKANTAEEIKAAGINAWHGVNEDSAGDIKDGQMTFGIWNANIPDYELSQTITGLANGTYEITAGLMAGSNGTGSRLTTQRIFGNLNSTYYASEADYDKEQLDKAEVSAFAGNEILVTDTEMRPVIVRAFVYDGTLTFGVRTDNNLAATFNGGLSNAGAGWFKVDNFTIKSLGYDAADAIGIYNHYSDILKAWDGEHMNKDVAAKLEEFVDALGGVTEASTADEIIAGIKAAKSMSDDVQTSVKVYERLSTIIERHLQSLEQYDSKPGSGLYYDAISEVQARYDDGEVVDEAEVDEIAEQLDAALDACIQSDDIKAGSILTDYIKNASFEDLSNQNNAASTGVADAPKGWNLYINGEQKQTAAEISGAGIQNWCAINSGDNIDVELEDGTTVSHQYSDGENLWGVWTAEIPEIELSQTIKGMPAGTYTATCDVLVQYNWAGYCITTQRIFANDYVAMYSYEGNYENNLPDDARMAQEIDEKLAPEATLKHLTYAGHECEAPRSDYSHRVSLTFGLAEKGDIKLGFRTNNIDHDGTAQGSGKGWFKLDNWTLKYDSAEVPAGAEIGSDKTGIDSVIDNAGSQTVEFYSVDGVRRSALQSGINIVKIGDKVSKVYVK